MDEIHINNLQFYGYHGVFPEETKLGQKFFVNLILFTDTKKAGVSDSLDDTINYKVVYDLVKHLVEVRKFKLIEALAENIASVLLEELDSLVNIEVEVRKPQVPIQGHCDYVSVKIRR